MTAPLITMLTDFGQGSPYVAAMKGVIWSLNPAVNIVDLTHTVPPQDIRQGAIALAETSRWFPPETIHVAVVDPGVGSARRLVYARFGSQQYLAPDNGLLGRLAAAGPPSTIRHLTERAWWREDVSATFHGRDILAPVAAHLSLGTPPESLGPPVAQLVPLAWPEVTMAARRIRGEVVSIDSFGNLVTNIGADQLAGVPTGEQLEILCDEHETRGLFRAYSDQPEMTLIALIGSSGYLELAIVGDSAAIMLGVKPGVAVTLSWP